MVKYENLLTVVADPSTGNITMLPPLKLYKSEDIPYQGHAKFMSLVFQVAAHDFFKPPFELYYNAE